MALYLNIGQTRLESIFFWSINIDSMLCWENFQI